MQLASQVRARRIADASVNTQFELWRSPQEIVMVAARCKIDRAPTGTPGDAVLTVIAYSPDVTDDTSRVQVRRLGGPPLGAWVVGDNLPQVFHGWYRPDTSRALVLAAVWDVTGATLSGPLTFTFEWSYLV